MSITLVTGNLGVCGFHLYRVVFNIESVLQLFVDFIEEHFVVGEIIMLDI